MTDLRVVRVELEATSASEAATALAEALGPDTWFVSGERSPELGQRVTIEAVLQGSSEVVLSAAGTVGWRYLAGAPRPAG